MKRLDLKDPNCWNIWRALYPTLTDEEQQDFANECEEAFPDQQHHDRSNFDYLFDKYNSIGPLKVLEIGGWKGELAQHCLDRNSNISSWINIEFCKNAQEKCIVKPDIHNERYCTMRPLVFDWFKNIKTFPFVDILVSAHTIEHLSNDHMKLFVKWLSGIPVVMFDAPLSIDGDNWDGFIGTHILTMGWAGVNQLMVNEGYEVSKVKDGCYLYQLKHL